MSIPTRVLELEQRSIGTRGAPALGDAYQVLREQWRAGDRDREVALHLMFLAWYLNIEPPFLTGLDERRTPSTQLCFGYRTVLIDPTVTERKKSKKRIEINDAEATVVRRIFTMYADGRGYRGIAKALNKEGAPSPRGRGWSTTAVWDMLREERYTGRWTYGERRVTGRQGKKVNMAPAPESDVIRLDRPDLAIIPPELWARVQDAMTSRTRDVTLLRSAREARVVHPLSNLLRCGVCGGMMRIKRCDSRTTSWSRRYYVCASRARSFKCANEIHLPADEVEQKLTAHLADNVLGQIEASIRASIRGEVQRILDSTGAREEQATQLRDEIESLRRERQRLVRLAAATDDPVPEVVDALSTNHQSAKALQEALAKATRPPIDPALAERLEAVAVTQVVRMREQLAAGELREALTVLFPAGLRFRVAGGLWLIEGAASVPTVRQPDTIRIPVATSRSTVISRDASS